MAVLGKVAIGDGHRMTKTVAAIATAAGDVLKLVKCEHARQTVAPWTLLVTAKPAAGCGWFGRMTPRMIVQIAWSVWIRGLTHCGTSLA